MGIRKWNPENIQMLFKLQYWCALRPMEAIVRTKADINVADRIIILGDTKTRDNDTTIIPTRFCTELSEWLNVQEEGRLFDGLTYHTYYLWLKRLGKMLDIEALNTPQSETHEKTIGHIFRKSVGKDMVYGEIRDKNGNKFQIPTISKHLRHAKPSITEDHYLKASQSQVAEIF